jgi:hypothetical protein
MREVLELARRAEFVAAGGTPKDEMESALLRAEVDRLYVIWGLRSIEGLKLDGLDATPETLRNSGPEELLREALAIVRHEAGLTEEERKN